jgi:hypothetical protein
LRHQHQTGHLLFYEVADDLYALSSGACRHVYESIVQKDNLTLDVALLQRVDFAGRTDPYNVSLDLDRVPFRIVERTIRVETEGLGHIVPVTSRGIGGHFCLVSLCGQV